MNKLSHSSYQEYLRDALSQIASKFSIKYYKRANLDDWPAFEKGIDIIVKVFWEKNLIYEFIIEKSFWIQRNINSKDRKHMRRCADPKIEMFRKCIIRKQPNGI